MGYDASNDPYIDQSTGVLRNLVGVTTQDELDQLEADVTPVIIATITAYDPQQIDNFDKQLLKDLHKEIFEPFYDWAGEFRTIDIGKGNSYFAHATYIDTFLDDVFSNLPENVSEIAKDKKDFVLYLTDLYSGLNAAHPFREGNGRTIRTFVRLVAINYGWDIEWARMDPDKNIAACAEAMRADEKLMRAMFDELLIKL